MTSRSLPEFRPMVVRCSAPHPRLLYVVQRKRPPLILYNARWTRQKACLNQAGGNFASRVAVVPTISPPVSIS
jgi:hypothetical protein